MNDSEATRVDDGGQEGQSADGGRSPAPSVIAENHRTAQRAFNTSIVVSGIRCTLTYVALPFIVPIIGLAPGIGPALGISIAVVAIVANISSIRRFWRAQHPWRRPITILHIGIIALMVVLIFNDVSTLLAP